MSIDVTKAHPEVACGYCKGIATGLRYHPLMQFHVCVDQGLCEKTRIYEVMLQRVRSA